MSLKIRVLDPSSLRAFHHEDSCPANPTPPHGRYQSNTCTCGVEVPLDLIDQTTLIGILGLGVNKTSHRSVLVLEFNPSREEEYPEDGRTRSDFEALGG